MQWTSGKLKERFSQSSLDHSSPLTAPSLPPLPGALASLSPVSPEPALIFTSSLQVPAKVYTASGLMAP